MVIAQLLQTIKDVSIHFSVVLCGIMHASLHVNITNHFLKLTTQGHLFLIHLLVKKPMPTHQAFQIFFSGEVLADTFDSFHLETRLVYVKEKKNWIWHLNIFKFSLEWLFLTITATTCITEESRLTSLFMSLEKPLCIYKQARVAVNVVCDSSSI